MKKILISLFLFIFLNEMGYALQPIKDVAMHDVVLQEGMTVKMAIVLGATAWKWVLSEESSNVIVARLYVKNKEITVRIPYTNKGYAIEYFESRNMEYNAKTHKINGKYNKWVNLLDRAISEKAINSGYNLPKNEKETSVSIGDNKLS